MGLTVIPAKAGIQSHTIKSLCGDWAPAFAGVTDGAKGQARV